MKKSKRLYPKIQSERGTSRAGGYRVEADEREAPRPSGGGHGNGEPTVSRWRLERLPR